MKPSIFIASSSNCKTHVEKLAEQLRKHFDCIQWHKDGFDLSTGTLESLEDKLNKTKAGIFIFSLDDVTLVDRREDNKLPSVRDNVILEFGMWAGRYGRQRAIVLCPNEFLKSVPSDLSGTTVLPVSNDFTSDAVVSASDKIITALNAALCFKYPDDYRHGNLLSERTITTLDCNHTYGIVLDAPSSTDFYIEIKRLSYPPQSGNQPSQQDICWGFPVDSFNNLDLQRANESNRTLGTQKIFPRTLNDGRYSCDITFGKRCNITIQIIDNSDAHILLEKSFVVN